jgi:hypothetical protein
LGWLQQQIKKRQPSNVAMGNSKVLICKEQKKKCEDADDAVVLGWVASSSTTEARIRQAFLIRGKSQNPFGGGGRLVRRYVRQQKLSDTRCGGRTLVCVL